jgi:transposase
MQSKVPDKNEQQSQLLNVVLQGGMANEKLGQYLTPFQRKLLLKNLQTDLRPEYRRRIEIMLLADTGQSQTQICETLGCSQETARYWISMAQAGQAHLWNERPVGRPKAVNEQFLDRLKELASHSPREYGYPFQRWTAQWLGKHLAKEFSIKVSTCHINRLLKSMGLSTRPGREATEKVAVDAQRTASHRVGTKDSRITISDLKSSSESDFLCLLQSHQDR